MKPDNTQETIYVGLDTGLPPYLPYPRFLLKMDISQTAKLLYALLLDRTTLSQRNGWQDDQGRTFIVYPIAEIAEMLDKGQTAIKAALNELDAAGLLERKRAGFSAANRLYVKLPPLVRISDPMTVGKATLISAENRPTDGRKSDLMTVGKPPPNNLTINNLIENQTMGVSGEPHKPFGRYENVFLSEAEYAELKTEFPDRLERLIEEMSRYLAANGRTYQNYAAALRIWAENDKKDAPKQGVPDYTCKEGESLFNMDGASKFHFDWKDLVKSGLSVKDAIAPTAFAFKNSRTFQMGGIFCAASFLSITASDISDQLLKDFLDMDSSQIVTMHIQSVDQNRAIKTVKRTITELDRSKIEEQKKAIRAGYDIDIIPSDLATYGRDAKALLKELQSQNERMFLVTFLVLNTGRTEQELENNVFQASSNSKYQNYSVKPKR